MRIVRVIVLLLMIVGAVNWGLWGAFKYDLIQDLTGSNTSGFARFLYVIVGLCGIYGISFLFSKGTCGFGCNCGSESNSEHE